MTRHARKLSDDSSSSSDTASSLSSRASAEKRSVRHRQRSDSTSSGSSSTTDDSEKYATRHAASNDADARSSDSDWSSDEDDRIHTHRRRRKHRTDRRTYYVLAALLLLLCLGASGTYYIMGEESDDASISTPTVSRKSSSMVSSSASSPSHYLPSSYRSQSKIRTSASASVSAPKSKDTATSKPSATSSSSPVPAATGGSPPPVATNAGPYKLTKSCEGSTFFDCFTFWDAADPTHGQVDYVPRDEAEKAGLIGNIGSSIFMRVDNTTSLAAGGFRKSVRIHSVDPVKINSVIIADIVKMPFGCGTWPAWWSHGPNWPAGGEIDILEGVNDGPINHVTLHTSTSDCKLDSGADATGKLVPENNDCNANVNGNRGCSYAEVVEADRSYGKPFNDAGGGVFATVFADDGISQYLWSRTNVPSNIEAPDVATWGQPTARFPSSTCKTDEFFADQTLIFDITLCGDWAGDAGVWNAACASAAPTCLDYVLKPEPWTDAVFQVDWVRVYAM